MSYDTLYFAGFLAVVWLVFKVAPWPGWVLLAASVAFYSAAGIRDSILATAIILINYGFQFAIVRHRLWLYPALAVNFGCLAYFKYRVFLASVAGTDLFSGTIVIPLGISFYVFQLSAFLIDIARKHAPPFTSLPRFALFKLFFGQLIAGPIMRWRQFGPQVNRLFDRQRLRGDRLVGLGLGLCLLGLAKKIVLADSLSPIADSIFRDMPANAAAAWLGAWIFGFQIYFDFSGYSDIALGLGLIFGILLCRNFSSPYAVTSIQDFWRSWHITLSSWFRDYVYIPLGGNRGTTWTTTRNLWIVFALCGAWHGASWNFIIWGMWHGFFLSIERLGATRSALSMSPKVVRNIYALAVVMVGWVFFRTADLGAAAEYLGTMWGLGAGGSANVPDDGMGGGLILAGCLALLALHWCERALFTRRAVRLLLRLDGLFLRVLFGGMATWLLILPKVQQNPFVYFRF